MLGKSDPTSSPLPQMDIAQDKPCPSLVESAFHAQYQGGMGKGEPGPLLRTKLLELPFAFNLHKERSGCFGWGLQPCPFPSPSILAHSGSRASTDSTSH